MRRQSANCTVSSLSQFIYGEVYCSQLCIYVICCYCIELSDIVVVVRSQKNSFHLQLAKEQDELWQQQFKFLQGKPARLLRLHEEWAPQGAWTIFPLIHQ